MKKFAIIVVAVALLCFRLEIARGDKIEYKLVENQDENDPVDAKLMAKTHWYYCGFDSMKKFDVTLKSSQNVTFYITDQKNAKNTQLKGKTCGAQENCKLEANGAILIFKRCVVVRYDGNNASDYTIIELLTTESKDEQLIWVFVGIGSGGLLVLTCFMCVCISICKRFCCGRRRAYKEYGKSTV